MILKATIFVITTALLTTIVEPKSHAQNKTCALGISNNKNLTRAIYAVFENTIDEQSVKLTRLPDIVYDYNITPILIGIRKNYTFLYPMFLNPTLHGTKAPTLAPPKFISERADVPNSLGPFIKLNRTLSAKNSMTNHKISFYGKIPSIIFEKSTKIALIATDEIRRIGRSITETMKINTYNDMSNFVSKILRNNYCIIQNIQAKKIGNIFTIIQYKDRKNIKYMRQCYVVRVLRHYGLMGVDFNIMKMYAKVNKNQSSGLVATREILIAIYGKYGAMNQIRYSGLPNEARLCQLIREIRKVQQIGED